MIQHDTASSTCVTILQFVFNCHLCLSGSVRNFHMQVPVVTWTWFDNIAYQKLKDLKDLKVLKVHQHPLASSRSIPRHPATCAKSGPKPQKTRIELHLRPRDPSRTSPTVAFEKHSHYRVLYRFIHFHPGILSQRLTITYLCIDATSCRILTYLEAVIAMVTKPGSAS